MQELPQRLFEFGPFVLDANQRLLCRDGERVSLTPKAFDTLVVLIENRGRLVEKDTLMKALWPDSFVEEANLTNNVWALRKILSEGLNGQTVIETVPKRGYRFTFPVKETTAAAQELVLEKHSITRIVTEEEDEPATAVTTKAGSAPKLRIALAVTAILVIGVALFVYLPWRWQKNSNSEAATIKQPLIRSMAVLPFRAIGKTTDDDYLSLGLADALITRLGNVQDISVRPTSAVRRYTDGQQDAGTIGRQQNVDAVLEGTFQRNNDRLRLTVQLIRVADGKTLWSGQFDERFTDILSVQDSISERVACDLVTRICGDESGRLVKQKKINIQAYESYLKGRYFWNKRTREGFQKAVDYFKDAIEIEPTYARAYAGLGDGYYFLGGNNIESQHESCEKARAAVKRALELDETLSEAHATLGLIAMNNDWNWVEAEKQFKRSIELSPNYATAHHWYGEFLAFMGRADEAINELQKAHELDPLSMIISTDVATVYCLMRRYDEAVKQFQLALEMDPDFPEAHALLALTYAMKGEPEAAIEEFKKNSGLEDNPHYLAWLGYAYGLAGKREEAQRILKRLDEFSKTTYVSPVFKSFIFVGLGQKEEAFRELEIVMAERHPAGAAHMKVTPIYDPLRTDPRYAKLLERTGLTQ